MSSYKAEEASIAEWNAVLLMEEDSATVNFPILVFSGGMNVNETDRIDTNIGIMRFLT